MGMRTTPNSTQIPISVVGSSKFGDYPKISLEKTYNMFESDGFIVPFPGYHKVLAPNDGALEGRGFFRSFRGNRMIAVIDSFVYDIDANMSARQIGILETSTGEVYMDENLESQICIVDGLNVYIYNYAIPSNIVKQTGSPFGTDLIPSYVAYHNTYFLIGNKNSANSSASSQWYSFIKNTDTTITVHSTMALQTKPDRPLAVVRIPGQAANVLVMGGSVCEIHTQTSGLNSAGAQIDYQRNNSISIDNGCLSVSTIATNDTHVVWLGINEVGMPVIMAMTGQEVKRISTDGIDFFLQSLVHPERSTAMMYTINGHLFYHLTFFYQNPAGGKEDNTTLLYDFTTDKFYHLSDQYLNYHPAVQLIYFNINNANQTSIFDDISQNIFFLSKKGGFIYQLSQKFTDINEDINDDPAAGTDPRLRFEMQRIRICPPVRMPTSAPFKVNQLCFTIEMGCDSIEAIQDCLIYMITEDEIRIFSENEIPNNNPQPNEPPFWPDYRQLVPEDAGQEDCVGRPYQGRIDLAISKDGAETFSNYVPRYMNPVGKRKNILRWNKMGRVNDFTAKIRFWTLGRVVAADGYIEVNP